MAREKKTMKRVWIGAVINLLFYCFGFMAGGKIFMGILLIGAIVGRTYLVKNTVRKRPNNSVLIKPYEVLVFAFNVDIETAADFVINVTPPQIVYSSNNVIKLFDAPTIWGK